MNNFCSLINLPELLKKFLYEYLMEFFFWCIFACCLHFSALSILANETLSAVLWPQAR